MHFFWVQYLGCANSKLVEISRRKSHCDFEQTQRIGRDEAHYLRKMPHVLVSLNIPTSLMHRICIMHYLNRGREILELQLVFSYSSKYPLFARTFFIPSPCRWRSVRYIAYQAKIKQNLNTCKLCTYLQLALCIQNIRICH